MALILFQAALAYMSGVVLLSTIKILMYRKKYPTEASQMRILKTFWTTEWAAFLLSTAFLPVWIFCLMNVLDKELYHVNIREFVYMISAGMGLGSQVAALSAFGRVSRILKAFEHDKIKEEGKQEGRDETLAKIEPLTKTNGEN
jgi:hypothetical protein